MTIRLDEVDRAALAALADRGGRDMSAEVRLALRRHLEREFDALKVARPGGGPGDAEPTPAREAEAVARAG